MTNDEKVGGLPELLDALLDYFGPMDDPSIGWLGSDASSPDLFKCERCGQENLDCAQIPHTPYCSAARLLKSMTTAFAEAERLR